MTTDLNSTFFTAEEQRNLELLGLLKSSDPIDVRRAVAGLLLVPVMEVCQRDSVTSPQEFQAVEEYVRRLEDQFELATREELESIGTEMGMLPMLPPTWDKSRMTSARGLLAMTLERMHEDDAHALRGAIAKACLEVARAGGAHLLDLHTVSSDERPLIHDIVQTLKLDQTAEGLHLLGKTGER